MQCLPTPGKLATVRLSRGGDLVDCTGEQHFQQPGNCCSENVTWVHPFNLCFLLLLLIISFAQLVVSAASPASLRCFFHCSLKLKKNKYTECINLRSATDQWQVELLPQASGWCLLGAVISNFSDLFLSRQVIAALTVVWCAQWRAWVPVISQLLRFLSLPHNSWAALGKAPQVQLYTTVSITGRFRSLEGFF